MLPLLLVWLFGCSVLVITNQYWIFSPTHTSAVHSMMVSRTALCRATVPCLVQRGSEEVALSLTSTEPKSVVHCQKQLILSLEF